MFYGADAVIAIKLKLDKSKTQNCDDTEFACVLMRNLSVCQFFDSIFFLSLHSYTHTHIQQTKNTHKNEYIRPFINTIDERICG